MFTDFAMVPELLSVCMTRLAWLLKLCVSVGL